ncbi:MAG: hypothetical protein ACLTYN_04845 [Dysosmobacter welbionis]
MKLAIARSCGIRRPSTTTRRMWSNGRRADGGRSGDRDRDLRQQRCAGYGRAGAQAPGRIVAVSWYNGPLSLWR